LKNFFLLFSILFLTSCFEDKKEPFADLRGETISPKEMDTIPDRLLTREEYTDRKGSAGVFKVDKMLALSVRDSSNEEGMAKKYADAFTKLETELKELGIKPFGAPGVITYNDDPANTVFECIYPIDSIPKRRPKVCHVAIIKAENMLIYNHYGSYGELSNSYQKIMKLMIKNQLLKTGPLREFYVTDPAKEKDQSKWLTRIMIPVITKSEMDSMLAARVPKKSAGKKKLK
jgi:effector-binding domain-containing protein